MKECWRTWYRCLSAWAPWTGWLSTARASPDTGVCLHELHGQAGCPQLGPHLIQVSVCMSSMDRLAIHSLGLTDFTSPGTITMQPWAEKNYVICTFCQSWALRQFLASTRQRRRSGPSAVVLRNNRHNCLLKKQFGDAPSIKFFLHKAFHFLSMFYKLVFHTYAWLRKPSPTD